MLKASAYQTTIQSVLSFDQASSYISVHFIVLNLGVVEERKPKISEKQSPQLNKVSIMNL